MFKDAPTFHKASEAAAVARNPNAQAFEAIKGATPGYVLGTVAGMVPQLRQYRPLLQAGGALASAAYDASQKYDPDATWTRVKRLGSDLTFDLSNLIKPITGSAAAVSGAERLLAKAGHGVDEAAVTARELVGTTLGHSSQPSEFGKFAQGLVDKGVSRADIAEQFGRRGEYFGRGQVGIGLGDSVASVTPGYQVQKAVDLPARAVRLAQAKKEAGTATHLGEKILAALPETAQIPSERYALRAAMKAQGRQARATTGQLKAQMMDEARGIAVLAKALEPGEYQQVIANIVDPGINGAATGYVPTESGKQVADALQEFFTKHEQTLKDIGVDLAYNKQSGRYYPRNFGIPNEGDTNLLERVMAGTQPTTAAHGVAAPNLKLREGDVAWGDILNKTPKGAELAKQVRAVPDLARDLALYGRQLSEAKGYHQLKKGLEAEFAEGGKLTPQAQEFLNKTYSSMSRAIEDRVDKLLFPESSGGGWMNSAGRAALQTLDTFHRAFKVNNLVFRLPYHVTNVFGDATLMAAHGVNPVSSLNEALALVKSAKTDANAAKILETARANNIGDTDFLTRLELPGVSRLAQSVNDLKVASGQRLAPLEEAQYLGKRVLDKIPGVNQVSRITHLWERYSKLGVYLDGLKKGMSPEAAAQRAYDILIDYQATTGQRGLTAQAQKAIMFYNYLTQAAKSGTQAALTNPSAFTAASKVSRDLSADTDTPAPRYLRESNIPIALGDTAKGVASAARQATGGDPFVGDTYVNPRFGAYDALSLPLALADAGSNIAQGGVAVVPSELAKLGRFANPTLKFGIESLTGRDVLTGSEKLPGSEVTRAPLLQPAERYAREVLAPTLLPSPVQAGLNAGIQALGGPDVAIGRPVEALSRPQNQLFSQLLGQVSPWRPVEAAPTSAYYDETESPQAQRLALLQQYLDRTSKTRRRVAERQRKAKP